MDKSVALAKAGVQTILALPDWKPALELCLSDLGHE